MDLPDGAIITFRIICYLLKLAYIKEMSDTEISHGVLSQITDRIIPDVKGMAEPTLGAPFMAFYGWMRCITR